MCRILSKICRIRSVVCEKNSLKIKKQRICRDQKILAYPLFFEKTSKMGESKLWVERKNVDSPQKECYNL